MQNGSILVGTLVRAEDNKVIFNTPFAGDINVAQANIKRIITDEAVVIMMDDGAVYRDRRIDATEGTLVAKAQGEAPVSFVTTDIKRINPEPWRLGDVYMWTGNAKAAAEFERGNSDTDEWDVSAKTVWRSLRDRYTIDGEFERDRNNGRKTSDNWTANGKYDRFSRRDPRNYWGGKVRFEYDRFADLDLRTTIGPHIGRQFLETGLITLSGEMGPVWVDEQFDTAEDNDFPGALWLLAGTSDIIGFGTELYMNHDGMFNFDDPDDLILNTIVGLKMPLTCPPNLPVGPPFRDDRRCLIATSHGATKPPRHACELLCAILPTKRVSILCRILFIISSSVDGYTHLGINYDEEGWPEGDYLARGHVKCCPEVSEVSQG